MDQEQRLGRFYPRHGISDPELRTEDQGTVTQDSRSGTHELESRIEDPGIRA